MRASERSDAGERQDLRGVHTEKAPRMTRRDLVALTGATFAEIKHWADVGWLPSCSGGVGTGHHRQFTPADVAAVTLAVKARIEYGPSAARRVLKRFKADWPGCCDICGDPARIICNDHVYDGIDEHGFKFVRPVGRQRRGCDKHRVEAHRETYDDIPTALRDGPITEESERYWRARFPELEF